MFRQHRRRSRALADMNAAKDKFFNIISHDLKDHAAVQVDILKMLVKNARLWDANILSAYYEQLLKSAEGHVELISNLLGWAQIQTGRIYYSPATIVISAFLPDISPIRKMAENKNISLVVNLPKDALITGDSQMLATVLRNLLTNAVKFTDEGGQVTLSVEPSVNGKYAFIVSDTGISMNREQINNLFRLDSAHSRRGTAGEKGGSLGLIICKEFLEKHGSKLHVESEEGKGSRFWFEL